MGKTKTPKKPAPGRAAERDAWIAAVEALVAEVEGWAAGWENWVTKRVPKTITEESLGTYTVPQLMMQSPAGWLLLNPVSGEAPGYIDMNAMPSFDAARLTRPNGRWEIYHHLPRRTRRRWTERSFLKTAAELFDFNG